MPKREKPQKPKKPRGQQPYEPADQDRKVVEAMAAYRIPQAEIADVLGITEPTLRKYFRTELDTGMAKLDARLTESLVRQAIGAPAEFDARGNCVRVEQRPYAPAAIFLLRRGEGIRDKAERKKETAAEQRQREQLEAAAEAAAEAARIEAEERRASLDLSDATDEELAVLERFFRRKAANNA